MVYVNNITTVSIILMIVGFTLVGIEMILPGFSFPGIGGTICLVLSIFMTSKTVEQGIALTIIIVLLLGVMLAIILWLLSKGKISRSFILTNQQNREEGYISSTNLDHLLGKKGVAHTDLRPTGVGEFDENSFDVISECYYIEKGTPIIVTQVKGSKLIVKENRKK